MEIIIVEKSVSTPMKHAHHETFNFPFVSHVKRREKRQVVSIGSSIEL